MTRLTFYISDKIMRLENRVVGSLTRCDCMYEIVHAAWQHAAVAQDNYMLGYGVSGLFVFVCRMMMDLQGCGG